MFWPRRRQAQARTAPRFGEMRAKPAQHGLPVHDPVGCGCRPSQELNIRCGGCRYARRAAQVARTSCRASRRATRTCRQHVGMAPSSSTRPSPSSRHGACGRSSRNCVAALAGQHTSPTMALVGIEHDLVDDADRGAGPGWPAGAEWLFNARCIGRHSQNKKYRWAIGSTSAGAQVSSSPSARTS